MQEKVKRKSAVTMNGGGLKCDNPLCDYIDMSIPVSDYKNLVNAPCPKCGANLLTKGDYRAFKIIRGIIRVINLVCFFMPKKEFDEDMATMKIAFDGSSKPIIGDITPYQK